jgi:hypothetical protein
MATDVRYGALQGMKVAADGAITYDFDGHIHAQGLDLDAYDLLEFADPHRIRWLNPDGSLAAGLEGVTLGYLQVLTASGQRRVVLTAAGESDFVQGSRRSDQKVAFGEGTYNTPAAAIGAIFSVPVTVPIPGGDAGGVVSIVAGGGLYSGIGYVGISNIDVGSITFDFQNNAGFALGASTINLAWAVWAPANPS